MINYLLEQNCDHSFFCKSYGVKYSMLKQYGNDDWLHIFQPSENWRDNNNDDQQDGSSDQTTPVCLGHLLI